MVGTDNVVEEGRGVETVWDVVNIGYVFKDFGYTFVIVRMDMFLQILVYLENEVN